MARSAHADLLFEIGSEELPYGAVRGAMAHLEHAARSAFERFRLPCDTIRVYGTPRRLVLIVERLAARQTEAATQIVGPPAAAAFDPAGQPTRAAEGFAKSQGVAVSSLQVVTTEKGRYAAVVRVERGKPATEVLAEWLPRVIGELPFARTMRWEGGGARFARPIRWLVALYGGRIIPFTYGGVTTGAVTRGHVLTSPGPIRITGGPAGYLRALHRRGVIVDHTVRKQEIADRLSAVARRAGGQPAEDEALLEQATFLTESPWAMAGRFDPRYLALPHEVIATVMKTHQGYFPLVSRTGLPMAGFLAVSNLKRAGRAAAVIRQGYERVLRARLDDARFYFDQDQRDKLADRVERLRGMVFQERLGTVYDKMERLVRGCRELAGAFGVEADRAERAARLCKTDLTTGIVREFPELQGVMGREYARRQQESDDVAQAIGDHYRPRFAGDEIPRQPLAQLLAVVDKMDTIVSCFATGLIPTGSQDPYALRRQGLGIVQIVRERPEILLSHLRGPMARPGADQGVLSDFFRQRIESQARAEGHRPDLIQAVLAIPDAADRPHVAFRRLVALASFAQRPAFNSLMTACKRVMNILADWSGDAGDMGPLTEEVERRLHAETERVAQEVRREEAAHHDEAVLEAFESLNPAIDAFFTDVMVMAEDPAVRRTRMMLLENVNRLLGRFADFRAVATDAAQR